MVVNGIPREIKMVLNARAPAHTHIHCTHKHNPLSYPAFDNVVTVLFVLVLQEQPYSLDGVVILFIFAEHNHREGEQALAVWSGGEEYIF